VVEFDGRRVVGRHVGRRFVVGRRLFVTDQFLVRAIPALGDAAVVVVVSSVDDGRFAVGHFALAVFLVCNLFKFSEGLEDGVDAVAVRAAVGLHLEAFQDVLLSPENRNEGKAFVKLSFSSGLVVVNQA